MQLEAPIPILRSFDESRARAFYIDYLGFAEDWAHRFEPQLPLYLQFIEHTKEHFAQEERWMVATGFAPDNCHASHHATIMETLHAVVEHYETDDKEIINRLAEALVEWFPQHAASMDAGLALHMKAVGFDSKTETLADPSAVRPATMSGCGSVSCS